MTDNAEADGEHADGYHSLFGVRLVSEMHLTDRNFDTCLGIIVLGSDWSDLLLPAIRVEICRQLHAVSNSFKFLTSEGFVSHMTAYITIAAFTDSKRICGCYSIYWVVGKMRNCGMRKVKCGIENAE